MSAIFVRARCAIKPGRLEDVRAAAAGLRQHTQGAPGVIAYEHFIDGAADEFIGVEGYDSETALLDHIAENDFGALFDAVDLVLLQVHGEPSPELVESLQAMAAVEVFPAALMHSSQLISPGRGPVVD